MSNTVITNYTDLNGPSTKADSSVVVIVNKDGSLSVDQNLLGTLMGTDGSQSAGISVVRVGHEGKPDDATDSETDDEKVPHVTLSVDSYYDEPNSIIKYDSGAEMLQSLRIETRENSLVGFQNDHCYTPLKSPSQTLPEKSENVKAYEESIIEISHTPPPKPVPTSKKITILEQQIISKGKKILIKPTESPIIFKGNDILNKPLPVVKSKEIREVEKQLETLQKSEESNESSSISSSGDSIPDRDSDSDYKDSKDRSGSVRLKKTKLKPRILKTLPSKASKPEPKIITKLKSTRNILRKENKEKIQLKKDVDVDLESLLPSSKISTTVSPNNDLSKVVVKQTPKVVKKEKKTPAHMTALLSDMTSLFSTPDVIRRVSTDTKIPPKTPTEKEILPAEKKLVVTNKLPESAVAKTVDNKFDITDKQKNTGSKPYIKPKERVISAEKVTKTFDPIPQLDDMSLAQILQDTSSIPNPVKSQPSISTPGNMNSPSLAGPLSPTLDLLGGLQPEEEGLTEDFLMSVAQLVASSENLQEVIDKQVLGKVDSVKSLHTPQTVQTPQTPPNQNIHQGTTANLYTQTLTKSAQKTIQPRKDPIEIVRRDGRVITLPPIEAPATRSSKRKSQMETLATGSVVPEVIQSVPQPLPVAVTPEPQVMTVSKQYVNKKLSTKKQEQIIPPASIEKVSAESQESWNSEDDPNRLWCICKQPHNNRFMICCDGCEDWFHGKCVNITKAMGQQMEEQGIEWRCPNCVKKAKSQPKKLQTPIVQKSEIEPAESDLKSPTDTSTKDKEMSKTSCIVCKKPARASSIYCSNNCIWKHAQDSLGTQNMQSKDEEETGKTTEKQKAESRVIVYERKSGRLLAGPNAPTAENLKSWLQSNPTFEVVRPGTLSTIKPGVGKKKSLETNKIQTTLNFERIPRKSSLEHPTSTKSPQSEAKERSIKLIPTPRVEPKPSPQLKSPVTPKSQQTILIDTPRPSTSTARPTVEPRKLIRGGARSHSTAEKTPSVTPTTSRRKDSADAKCRMSSGEPVRDNVRKALHEQMSIRMAESKGKFTEDEIQQFANDTEYELHELFRDVGMKYKAKYRSLMFNIKDRKNLTLWQKICDRSITPKQLVRLSPEELASQELAQWRDKESKYQLELIKKSELDLLAASKTYVLKTHKGEEVMETKESVSTELDPNVPVEDVVTALNDSTVGPDVLKDTAQVNSPKSKNTDKKHSSKKRNRPDSNSGHSKKSKRDSKRDSGRKSRSSRRRSDSKDEKDSNSTQRRSKRRSERSSRARSASKDRSKTEAKEKSDSSERSRYRSSSRDRSRRRSKSRDYSQSRSKSQGRERSRSRARSRRRSQSRDGSRRRRSRSKVRRSSDDKLKHRSRSQDNAYNKSKHDSTDSDSVERPKSAMLKEAHPEYDPHEPMITSAFSEEDLRKSREDVFEENYRNEMSTFESAYDPSKSIESNIIIPETTFTSTKQDKTSEVESDQEPSSTVENSSVTVWSGCINMVDVARFYVAAHEVSGSSADLEDDLSTELDIVGRINPHTVWDYIGKMKKTSNKDIVILKLQTANDEEKMQYIALYSYLSSRNRLGVVKVANMTTVKDLYIVPLPANTELPAVLLPLDGPGLADVKTHLLVAIVIRQRRKRAAPPADLVPAKVATSRRKRSYTPPASPRRRALPLPAYTSTSLSTTVKDKIAASLVSADDDEPYSPGSSNGSAGAPADALRTKMEELNRQIEEQKQQILKMARADSSVGEDEAYSPSRPMTPPGVQAVGLADIALPSNLQEILATIKQRSEPSADVDMRTLPLS